MGAINHQPCGKYLARSTRVSRCLSLAHAHLELANVAFEDVILAELDNRVGTVKPIVESLVSSRDAVSQLVEGIDELTAFMRESGYEDLPPLRSLDLDAIGKDLERRGVTSGAWYVMKDIVLRGGYFAAFRHLRAKAERILGLTERLAPAFEALSGFSERGELARVLEENRPGNVRPLFAETYTAWNEFHAHFLASSLISSEVWYAFNGYGSMSHSSACLRIA